ncbi:hypothetical protein SpAn4DRAFT_0329 [Sporomusa ovata]|uniref:Uncharacterized protein n=1 Tax=Sporomusa ovata TaxID=2378 RepID=A0A0U1L2F8_9FIRM|nr:hypothetical protein SpAn4DRAFT_0329 [Sporomusa ovata]
MLRLLDIFSPYISMAAFPLFLHNNFLPYVVHGQVFIMENNSFLYIII